MRLALILIPAVLLAAAASAGYAFEEDEIVFSTGPEGMTLFEAANWIGRHVEGAVTFAPPALKVVRRPDARVRLTEPVRLTRERVLGFGQDLLAPFGLVLFNIGRPEQPLWLVENLGEPTVLVGRTVFVPADQVVRHRHERTPITTTVELLKAPVDRVQEEVREALKGTLPPGAEVIPVAATNGFILRGPGRNVHAWMQLIAQLDRTPAPAARPKSRPDDETLKGLEDRLRQLEARVQGLEAGAQTSDTKPGEAKPGGAKPSGTKS